MPWFWLEYASYILIHIAQSESASRNRKKSGSCRALNQQKAGPVPVNGFNIAERGKTNTCSSLQIIILLLRDVTFIYSSPPPGEKKHGEPWLKKHQPSTNHHQLRSFPSHWSLATSRPKDTSPSTDSASSSAPPSRGTDARRKRRFFKNVELHRYTL